MATASSTSPTPGPASGSSPAAVPPELQGKRGPGRPPGSTNKPKAAAPAPDLSPRALAAAYQGMWLVLRFVTFLVAGRERSPVAQAMGAPWVLEDLEADEAMSDARDLMPFVSEHAALVRVLAWIGGPVIVFKRISAKLRKKPRPEPAAAPEPAK